MAKKKTTEPSDVIEVVEPVETAQVVETAEDEQQKKEPLLEITGTRQFTSWLYEQKASLAFTTYQTGKFFLIGLQPDGRLSIFERTFNRCMGLCRDEDRLYLSSLYQLWRFENILEPGQLHNGFDRLYVPMVGYTTGDLDVHDICVDADGRVIFVNTLFSCIATLGDKFSFKPLWKPNFITKLAAEDRCHLNGLAMENGKPKYVTAVSQTDVHEGWREHRRDGGVVIDVDSNEIIAQGLSMPHSPRLYKDKLWILDSGTGNFGYVDIASGKFETVAFCPGYARGLSFIGNFAVIGLSTIRHNKTFSGLPLDDALKEKGVSPRCALQIVDLNSGDVVHALNIKGVVEELYDVVTLPNAIRPMALGFKTEEIRRILRVDEGENL